MSTSLVYTISPYVPFTKILSSNINQDKTDLQSRINWAGGTSTTTGLGDDNIQSNTVSGGGLTRSSKLKAGTANYVIVNDSSGKLSQEAQLATSRGGTGADLSSGVVTGDVIYWTGSAFSTTGPIPPGAVFPYVNGAAPTGYLNCDGSAVSRTTYARLFAIIGANYGQGDNSTTFNLPDMRGMFVRGASSWLTQSVSYSAGTNLFTAAAGAITRSGQPVQFSTSGSGIPSNLSTSTTYWTVFASATTFYVATSEANALAGTTTTAGASGLSCNCLNWADPDVSTRTAATTGAATIQIGGSVQSDQFQDHTHSIIAQPNVAFSGNIFTGVITVGGTTLNTNGAVSGNHGLETRPKNLYLYYIIKT